MQNPYKITLLVMWMTTLGQAAIALYLPAFPAIAASLHISPSIVKMTITLFLFGYGFSQLFYGPLSDRYGRKPILLIGMNIFCMGCLINIFAHTEKIFLFARLLQGLGCGCTITIGRSILRDCFTGRELASAASYTSMGFAIGFGTTPLIGAYLQSYLGWQADFVFLLCLGLILLFIIWRWLPETSLHLNTNLSLPDFFLETLKNYKSIISHQLFLKFLLAGLFAYGVVIAYNVMTPFLIQNALGYSAKFYGCLALLIAAPYYIAASLNRKLVIRFGTGPIFAFGIILVLSGGFVMLLLSVLSTKILLSGVILPMMIATFGQALIFPNTISSALQIFSQEFSGKASAIFSSMQMLLTSVLSAVMAIPSDTTQCPLAIILICLGLLSGLILFKHIFLSFKNYRK